MKKEIKTISAAIVGLVLAHLQALSAEATLKVHGIFRSHMVQQRDKPITIWGWAPEGKDVEVSFVTLSAQGQASGDKGRWEVDFEAQPANTIPQAITVKSGDDVIRMDNILIGDVWVMYGQSNMAIGLRTIYEGQFEASMAHLPLMRHLRIRGGAESEHVETDLRDEYISNEDDADKNWKIVTPEVALDIGAIGYVFGSRLRRSQRIPQLHTAKKKELGLRAAQWALHTIYGKEAIGWESATLLSAVPEAGGMLLTFDKRVIPDDLGSELEGFSIADTSGVFHMAEAVAKPLADKALRDTQILVSSPLVAEPVAVRYSWATSPMGNLKVNGIPSQPLHNFRTDEGGFPPEIAHHDPDGPAKNSEAIKVMKAESTLALKTRLQATPAK